MSDFLRNLRSSHKKDTPAPRKSMDQQQYYPQTDRRVLRDRRASQPGQYAPPADDLTRQLGDTLPLLIDNTTTLAEQVEKMATINEMMMEARIRQYNAVADFFEDLKGLLGDLPAPEASGMPKATASYASGTHYTKDDILSIINNMRDQGATFAIIADYLKEKGIPTFSGRGEWHAQTIHRLCK